MSILSKTLRKSVRYLVTSGRWRLIPLRRDAMRRHTSRCLERGYRDTPKASRRGPSKACCARCSRLKVACDKGDPCSRCKSSRHPCQYADPTKTPHFATHSPPSNSSRSMKTSHSVRPSCAASRVKASIPFLLSYVDPETSFEELMKATNEHPIGTLENKEDTPPAPENMSILDYTVDWSTSSFLNGLCGLFDFPEDSDSLFDVEPLWNTQDQAQMTDIKSRLDGLFEQLQPYRSRTEPHILDGACESDATMTNTYVVADVDKTIRAYFDYAARHTPIVCRSIFNISTISSHLLLAILAAGGQVNPVHSGQFSSPRFFDSVQDFIFDQETFQVSHPCDCQNHPVGNETLEILQAGLIVLCTEVATTDNPHSHKTCKLRFSKLVAVIRELSLSKVRRHIPFANIGSSYDPRISLPLSQERFLRDEASIRSAFTKRHL